MAELFQPEISKSQNFIEASPVVAASNVTAGLINAAERVGVGFANRILADLPKPETPAEARERTKFELEMRDRTNRDEALSLVGAALGGGSFKSSNPLAMRTYRQFQMAVQVSKQDPTKGRTLLNQARASASALYPSAAPYISSITDDFMGVTNLEVAEERADAAAKRSIVSTAISKGFGLSETSDPLNPTPSDVAKASQFVTAYARFDNDLELKKMQLDELYRSKSLDIRAAGVNTARDTNQEKRIVNGILQGTYESSQSILGTHLIEWNKEASRIYDIKDPMVQKAELFKLSQKVNSITSELKVKVGASVGAVGTTGTAFLFKQIDDTVKPFTDMVSAPDFASSARTAERVNMLKNDAMDRIVTRDPPLAAMLFNDSIANAAGAKFNTSLISAIESLGATSQDLSAVRKTQQSGGDPLRDLSTKQQRLLAKEFSYLKDTRISSEDLSQAKRDSYIAASKLAKGNAEDTIAFTKGIKPIVLEDDLQRMKTYDPSGASDVASSIISMAEENASRTKDLSSAMTLPNKVVFNGTKNKFEFSVQSPGEQAVRSGFILGPSGTNPVTDTVDPSLYKSLSASVESLNKALDLVVVAAPYSRSKIDRKEYAKGLAEEVGLEVIQ